MIGNAANVKRFAVTLAVGGRVDSTRVIAAFTRSSVWNMSTFQEKNRSSSAEPRLVIDRTFSSPWTALSESSTGRVMVTSIWSIGITPLSIPMMMRGKSVEGKTEIGMVNAR